MASAAILRKRHRNFVSDLKPNHSKFEELKNPFEKLKSLKSLSFLSNSKSNLSSAKVLRKTTSDSYLLNWKVKKKELRKFEKQFWDIKMKYDQEELSYRSTVLNHKNNVKLDVESTFFNTFPMQFGNIFGIKNLTFPDRSMFESLGSLFSNNIKTKNKNEQLNFEKGVNTSFATFSKEIQTDNSKTNTKTQNVRVKTKSKRIQTDCTDSNKTIIKQTNCVRKATKLNHISHENEDYIKKHVTRQSEPALGQKNTAKIASKSHINPSVFKLSQYHNLMDTCGFEIFSNFFSKSETHQRDNPKTSYQSNSMKRKPSNANRSDYFHKNMSKYSNETLQSKNINKIACKTNDNKTDSEEKRLQYNTATIDQVCSVETKKSIDLVALRNFILRLSPLAQKSSVEMKKHSNTLISPPADRNIKRSTKMSSHCSVKIKGSSKNTERSPASKRIIPASKRISRVETRQSIDKNIGTDYDEITNFLPHINQRVNFKAESELLPKQNFDFKPMVFNQNEWQIFGMYENNSQRKRFKKSATFQTGLVKKVAKPQTPPPKFVGRHGNIFDYVSCITSTSSTIYSSSESLRKIFARSKMSLLTVESDYNSLLQILSTCTDQNISMINCETLTKDCNTKVNDEVKIVSDVVDIISKEDLKQDITVTHVEVEQCCGDIFKESEESKEKSKLKFEISDEENVVAISNCSESDSFDIVTKESKTRKCKQFGNKILKTISRLSHRKKSSNKSDQTKLLKNSSDKLYKKKCKEILKEHKIREDFVDLKKVSSCKMLRQYIFNIGQIEGVPHSPVVINLRLDSLEISSKDSSKNNTLKSMFNCVVSKSSNIVPEKKIPIKLDSSKVPYKKYSDEIIAKEEQRLVFKSIEEIAVKEHDKIITNNCNNVPSKLQLDDYDEDIMNKSLEDIRILFRSSFSSDTEISEYELGDQNKKIIVEKKLSSTDIKSPQRLIELKVNPSSPDGEKCFLNPISIYVDPNTEAIGADGIYRIECLDTVVVESKNDAMWKNKNLKSPMKIQINLILHQL